MKPRSLYTRISFVYNVGVPLPYLGTHGSHTRPILSVQDTYQIEVELGDLTEVGKEFARLLDERLKTDVEINGSKLMLRGRSSEHLRLKDVKLAAKHVLHHLGFSHSYRVLSEHSVLRIVRVEKKRRHVEKEAMPPSPSQSLPYLFPT